MSEGKCESNDRLADKAVGHWISIVIKQVHEASKNELERRKIMNKLEKAIADIHSPYFNSVVRDCDYSSSTRLGNTGPTDGFGDHRHSIYGYKIAAPSETSFNNLISDLRAIGTAANEELLSFGKKIEALGTVFAESSELVLSFKQTHDALVAEMIAEQSSHRRFEQLAQTFDAKVREVRAIYDTVDEAVKKATEDASSGVIKQIDDKGKSVVSDMEQEVRRRVEEVLKGVFAKAHDDMSKVVEETTKSVQAELMGMGQKFDCAVDVRIKSVKSDMAQQLESLSRRGNELLSRLGSMSLEIDKRADEIEKSLNDMISAAETKLTMDVHSEVPALFRSNTGGSSFLRRLKWLFFGRV